MKTTTNSTEENSTSTPSFDLQNQQKPNSQTQSQSDSSNNFKNNGLTSFLLPVLSIFLLLSLSFNIILFSSFFLQKDISLNAVLPRQTSKEQILQIIKQRSLNNPADEKTVYEYELKGLVASLKDPYSEFLPASEAQDFHDSLNERYEGIGVRFEFDKGEVVVTQVISGGPAQKADVKIGDIFYQIDDTKAQDIATDKIAEKVRGPKGSSVKIIFLRNQEKLEKNITREQIQTPLIELDVKNSAAVITISSFGENLDQSMQTIAKQIKQNPSVKEIIIDLRGNTGGILSETVEVASYFVPEKTLLLYEESKKGKENLYSLGKTDEIQNLPVTVLVNNSSASASEILAGALKNQDKARVVGQATFGKGVVQQIFPLKNGDQLKLTIAKWFLPDGSEIDHKGLKPDVELKISEDALEWALKNPIS